MRKICGIDVEFAKNGSILFRDGEVKIVAVLDVANDYLPFFEAIAAKQAWKVHPLGNCDQCDHKHGDVEFAWSNNDLEIIQGDKKIVLKELVGGQLDIFCMMAAKLLMEIQ
jgi:hypothetical protein